MQRFLLNIAKRFWPDLASMPIERQVVGVGEVISFLYAAPLAMVGLVWLWRVSDWVLLLENAPLMLLFLVLNAMFFQLRFFLIVELRTNRYGSSDGTMAGIVIWSAILLIGPGAIWLSVIWFVLQMLLKFKQATNLAEVWNQRRNLVMSIAGETFAPLVALSLYDTWGGEYPFPGLEFTAIWPAFGAMLVSAILYTVLWAGYFGYATWVQKNLNRSNPIRPLVVFFFLSIGLPQLVLPFAILAAGLYVQNGLFIYLFFMGGMLVVAALTRRLSLAIESSRQQNRVLGKLEQLSRDIISSPANQEALSKILQEHIPNMFPSGKIMIWKFPNHVLFNSRPDWEPDFNQVWPWLLEKSTVKSYLANEPFPWEEKKIKGPHNPVIVAPILSVEGNQPFAGVYLELHTLAQPWTRRSINNIMPGVQSLGDQIASAIHREEITSQTLELARVTQELQLAGSIQSSLLPYSFPSIPGWQLAVSLTPAGQMAGDFFDIIPLSDGKVGIVIADVLDKGLGPALYMALSRTLIRTYATEFDFDPDTVFFATNERILTDTRANLFVTVFFGILDPATGKLTYSNAGHNPPYLFSSQNGGEVVPLRRTGIPIGIDEDATWDHVTVEMEPGACLVMYTDGIPEADNGQGEFFEEQPLVDIAKENLDQTAEVIQASIMRAVYTFLDGKPPSDDITLMILKRDRQTES